MTKSIDPNLSWQTYVRLTSSELERLDKRAAMEGLRRAAYFRSVVLQSLVSSLPTMALKAAGGTEKRDAPTCLRLRSSDHKRLELRAKEAGVTTSEFLRAVLTEDARKK